ncbi:squalene/phytoene synthase family protein, partial [Proteus terrae]
MADKKFPKDAMRVLKETSRTFYIPITFLEKELKHTVASAYLVLRAIDEIEDHEALSNDMKYNTLMQISELFKETFDEDKYLQILAPVKNDMPEVTIRLGEWIDACPEHTRAVVLE